MKSYLFKKQFSDEIIKVLSAASRVEDALVPLSSVYEAIIKSLPFISQFQLSLVKTESLRYSVFYQGSPDMSENSIMISNVEYEAYLWIDSNKWCLDDDLYKVNEIAHQLSEAPLFNNIPENIRELEYLLKGKYWKFSTENLPCFGGEKPNDENEVLSWDKKYILAGTSLNNLAIIPRDEWNRLCNNESNWFKNA